MSYLNNPVVYLQDSDFDASGNLQNDMLTNKMVLVMMQSNFCGHCTRAKPEFQKLGEEIAQSPVASDVVTATIQADGSEPGESELGQRLTSILPSFKGFPTYVLFWKGKPIGEINSGRDAASLKQATLDALATKSTM